MATKVDIANLALSYLGDQFITATDLTAPSTPHAQLVVNVLDLTLDDFLAEHDWDFSTVWSLELTPVVGLSSPDFNYYFNLPDGVATLDPYCLLVRATNQDDAQEMWQVQGRRIGMAYSNLIKIKYRSRPDISAWTPAAITAVSYTIAAKIGYAITESQSTTDQMKKLAEFELRRARSQNSMERSVQTVRSRSLLDVRLQG